MTSLDNTPPTSSCSICSEYVQENRLDFRGRRADTSRVVHQICSECDAFEADTSQLCHFCSHIRPNHLLTCRCVPDILEENEDGNFEIMLGTPPELFSRQKDCAFCRWCLGIIQGQARLLQHTINEKRPVSIDRFARRKRLLHETSHDAPIDRDVYLSLIYGTTTSQSFRYNRDCHIEISHNKRPRVLAANHNNTTTELGLSEFALEHFSTPPSVIDWATVRRWKATCDKECGNCLKGAIGKLPGGFRLIDVEMECVTATKLGSVSFSALSYVWGAQAENEITARRDTLSVLMQPHSLGNLPWTISHAMHVCKQMGQRYLWVDRLCIVQDDKEDKYGQIGSLEAIYSRADLVIVAACGDGMGSGLAGVNEEFPREQWQFPLNTFGFTLANKLPGLDVATHSAWGRRGWTYQEAVLSKRKLYFTPCEVWWECEGGHMRESLFSSDRMIHAGYLLKAINTGDIDDTYEGYRHHVEQYSARILSYPSDIYYAFRGIENAFYPGGRFVHGLPESDFSRALLWYPYVLPGLRERRCDNQDVILPSWSWASFEGRVGTHGLYSTQYNGRRIRSLGSFYCSLCEWDTWDGNHGKQGSRRINSINDQNVWAQLDRIWSNSRRIRKYPDFFDSLPSSPDYRQFLAMAWSKGCVEANVHDDLSNPESDSMSPQALESRWPTMSAFLVEVAVQRRDHPSANLHGCPRLNPGQVSTRTQWSVLSIECVGKHGHFEECIIRSASSDKHESAIGALINAAEYRLRSTGPSHGVADVDFIALAIGTMPPGFTSRIDRDILEKNCFHVSQPKDEIQYGQPGVIVMAVRWSGSIAHRLGLGWVTLQGWVDSNPEFRTIVLA